MELIAAHFEAGYKEVHYGSLQFNRKNERTMTSVVYQQGSSNVQSDTSFAELKKGVLQIIGDAVDTQNTTAASATAASASSSSSSLINELSKKIKNKECDSTEKLKIILKKINDIKLKSECMNKVNDFEKASQTVPFSNK